VPFFFYHSQGFFPGCLPTTSPTDLCSATEASFPIHFWGKTIRSLDFFKSRAFFSTILKARRSLDGFGVRNFYFFRQGSLILWCPFVHLCFAFWFRPCLVFLLFTQLPQPAPPIPLRFFLDFPFDSPSSSPMPFNNDAFFCILLPFFG